MPLFLTEREESLFSLFDLDHNLLKQHFIGLHRKITHCTELLASQGNDRTGGNRA